MVLVKAKPLFQGLCCVPEKNIPIPLQIQKLLLSLRSLSEITFFVEAESERMMMMRSDTLKVKVEKSTK